MRCRAPRKGPQRNFIEGGVSENANPGLARCRLATKRHCTTAWGEKRGKKSRTRTHAAARRHPPGDREKKEKNEPQSAGFGQRGALIDRSSLRAEIEAPRIGGEKEGTEEVVPVQTRNPEKTIEHFSPAGNLLISVKPEGSRERFLGADKASSSSVQEGGFNAPFSSLPPRGTDLPASINWGRRSRRRLACL